jgi:CheY-like chemotaxis protein
LNSIIGFSEILKDQVAGKLNEQQSRYVGHILDSGRHLLKLINDILDLAKVESGKMELEVSRINLRKLLETSLLMIREKAIKHRLKTRLRLGESLEDLQIEADEVKLKQIMFNLLSNAAKFTPDGGEIIVSGEKPREEIRVSVSDSGIGLKPEDQERIFAVFEQVDSSYAREEQGTGLGLALTKQLVELHGGVIYAESEGLGKGSTFTFIIPVTESVKKAGESIENRFLDAAAERTASAPAHFSVNGSSPVILIVEDNEVNMNLATTCLEEAGYRVLQARTAREGLKIAKAEVPDLILMDIGLPGMDGLTATGILRDDPQIQHVPVVALTAHAMSGDKEKALEAGCTGYIAKPIDTRTFSGTVGELMEAAKDA